MHGRSLYFTPSGGAAVASSPVPATRSDQLPLPLSTWLVVPTSTSAHAASFHLEVEIDGVNTRVLAEQAAAVGPGRLGKSVGFLSFAEISRVDAALRIVLDL